MAPVHRFTYLAGTVGYAVTCGLVRTHVALVAVGLFAHLHTPNADLWGTALVMVGLGPAVRRPRPSGRRAAAPVHGARRPGDAADPGHRPARLGRPPPDLGAAGLASVAGWPVVRHYTLDAERAAVVHGAGWPVVGPDVLRLLAAGVALVPAGLLAFQWGERVALRTGRLKRSGRGRADGPGKRSAGEAEGRPGGPWRGGRASVPGSATGAGLRQGRIASSAGRPGTVHGPTARSWAEADKRTAGDRRSAMPAARDKARRRPSRGAASPALPGLRPQVRPRARRPRRRPDPSP